LASTGVRSGDEREGKGEKLRETGDSTREERVGRVECVRREFDLNSKTKETSFARMMLLVRDPPCVVGTNLREHERGREWMRKKERWMKEEQRRRGCMADLASIGEIPSSKRPDRGDEKTVVMETYVWTNKRVKAFPTADTGIWSEDTLLQRVREVAREIERSREREGQREEGERSRDEGQSFREEQEGGK
jgi:hypothetical protein